MLRVLVGLLAPMGPLIHKEASKDVTRLVCPKGEFLVKLSIFRETSGIYYVDCCVYIHVTMHRM